MPADILRPLPSAEATNRVRVSSLTPPKFSPLNLFLGLDIENIVPPG